MPAKKSEKPAEKPAKATKPPAITKHKATQARRPTVGEGQTFDIVPPSRVVPSATSRPVITANRPQQTDNTLVAETASTEVPSSAPMVHKKLTLDITTPAADTTAQADAKDESGTPGAPLMPAKPGPTVGELLSAKKSDAAPEPETAAEPETSSEPEAEPVEEPGLKPDSETETEPETEPEPEKETAAAGTDKPVEDAKSDETTDKDADKPAGELKIEPPVTDDKPKETPEANKPAEEAKTETAPADDTLAGVLTSEPAAEPAEHSPEFNKALDDLKTSDEGKHPQEAKLYGGKPVIVVHEPHPVLSVLKWLFWFIISLGLALLVFNLLLDAGVVSVGSELPHTDIIKQ
jgi:hypothetical protein